MENLSILRPSKITNINKQTIASREKFLQTWEDTLKQKEQQLELKHQQLKKYSKQIKEESAQLVQQKLELGEKTTKYSKILEQIVNTSQYSMPRAITPIPPRTMRASNLNECQARVAVLLQSIRNTSSFTKTPPQSYIGSEYEDILFSKRNANTSSEVNDGSQRQFYKNVYQEMDKLRRN